MPEFRDPTYGAQPVSAATATSGWGILLLTAVGVRDQYILEDQFRLLMEASVVTPTEFSANKTQSVSETELRFTGHDAVLTVGDDATFRDTHIKNGGTGTLTIESSIGDTIDDAGAIALAPDESIRLRRVISAANKLESYAFSGKRSGLVKPWDFVIKGTGNTANDDAQWDAALAFFSNQGFAGTVWLDSSNYPVRINAVKSWGNYVPSIRGLNKGSGLEVMSSSAQFKTTTWLPSVAGASGTAISNITAGDDTITSPTLALNRGDWVMVYANDTITNGGDGVGGGVAHPAEMLFIHYEHAANVYGVNERIYDSYTSSPKVEIVPIRKRPNLNKSNAIFDNFTLLQSSEFDAGVLFNLFTLDGIDIEDIAWQTSNASGAPGYFFFRSCANINIRGIDVDGVHGTDGPSGTDPAGRGYGYVFVADACNGFSMTDGTYRRQRHAFTTESVATSGNDAWGNLRNATISNNKFWSNYANGQINPVDTHFEGVEVVFSNNDIYVSEIDYPTTDQIGQGAIVRCRRMQITQNRFYGSQNRLCKGITVYSDDCNIVDNDFYGFWIPVQIRDIAGVITPNRCTVINNRFHGTSYTTGTPVYIQHGSDHRVEGNYFHDYPRQGIVISTTGTGIKINHNVFDNIGHGGASSTLDFEATTDDVDIIGNTFIDCDNVVIDIIGAGDNYHIINNSFVRCSPSNSVIKFDAATVGTGHIIRENDLSKYSNTYSVDVGALTTSDIKIRGNCMDGYGAGSLGLNNDGGGSIDAQEDAYNHTD